MHTTTTPRLRAVLRRLHDEETGAQAMEYAALGAMGVGIGGIIVELLTSEPIQDVIAGLLTDVIEQLGTALGGLF